MNEMQLDENGLLDVNSWLEYVSQMPVNVKNKVKEYYHNIGNEVEHFGGTLGIGHDGEFFYVLTIDGVMSEKNY